MKLSKLKGVNQHSYIRMHDLFITHRQLYVFKMLASGYNTKEIANIQGCSQRCVHHCMRACIKRNGYQSSFQALYFIAKKKLI